MSDREAFEKWYMSRGWVDTFDPLVKHDHGAYIVTETCEAWEAWQAAQTQTLLEVIRDTTGCPTKALQSGEPVVFTCHGNNAPAYGCNTPGDMSGTYYKSPQPPTTKPIAAIKGWFHGECVVQALDPEAVLPAGMALYATPQPVVPELTGKQWSAMRTVIHEYAKKFRSADTYEMASAYMDAAPEAVYQALLSAGKGGE
jgi:hypothetical protein